MKVYFDIDTPADDILAAFVAAFYEKECYQVRWLLRHLEQEINQAGGQITIISKDGVTGVQTKGFPVALADKIEQIISRSGYRVSNFIKNPIL